jgi:hypothetical protein
MTKLVRAALLCATLSAVALMVFAGPLDAAKNTPGTPPEYGVYVKTSKKLVRILPNMLFEGKGGLYLDSNKPPHFLLNEIRYFVLSGRYEVKVLTLNNLTFIGGSGLGMDRYGIAGEVPIEVKKKSDTTYTVRTKGLFGRGYYALWINDCAWDFVVE